MAGEDWQLLLQQQPLNLPQQQQLVLPPQLLQKFLLRFQEKCLLVQEVQEVQLV